MTAAELAALHAASFSRPRPWSEAEFTALLTDGTCFLITEDHGFVLGRSVSDEAELLTIAVAQAARRQGIGQTLLSRFEAEAARRGTATAFLEVAADNVAALQLYSGAGWQNAGRRRNYYGDGADAAVMRKSL
ncbi:ribosomal protein S18-alanine N-acetyltransferase [Paracoccus albus]|uniref:ribosomal protein S18-alanine N-acetyltransferase n=1 Tax=Paracoccus albus TaxID=3017784 RepID=UPI0022F07664|nr:ribosomal protein S18-alanine N-acetyltransferase [Paracoccus albus]WBU60474.1 ribosomal protein S18-alanine N-acetyltransferase [Paracoccus albus]